MKLLILAVGIALIAGCFALDCPECNLNNCKEKGPCHFGQTVDVCGCCPDCYKGPGEECGGPWNVLGVCAQHLTCVKLQKDLNPIEEFNAAGECLYLPK